MHALRKSAEEVLGLVLQYVHNNMDPYGLVSLSKFKNTYYLEIERKAYRSFSETRKKKTAAEKVKEITVWLEE